MEGLWEYHSAHDFSKMKRPDDRIKSLLPTTSARGTRKYFTIDIDDKSIADEILEKIKEYTGFTPARIFTPRGMHILLSWEDIPREKREEFRVRVLLRLRKEYGEKAEWKKLPQEPLPGTEYKRKGFVVRFKPDRSRPGFVFLVFANYLYDYFLSFIRGAD